MISIIKCFNLKSCNICFKVFIQRLCSSMDSRNHKKLIYTGSFWEAISPILFCSRILGIFPLSGIRPKPRKSVHFSWFSFGSLICLTFMTWDAIYILTHIHFHRKSNLSASIISTNVFFSMGLLIYAVFLKLARRWINMVGWWTEKEQRFLQAPYVTKRSKKLKQTFITIAFAIAALAIAEHGLYQISDIYTYVKVSNECNVTGSRGVRSFMFKRFEHVHAYIPGMVAMALCQINSMFATAAWNFLDLYIIFINIWITTRLEQLTSALKTHLKHKIPDSKSMLKFRMDFITICELLDSVDKRMGLFIFLSAVNNLYFVCLQLLNAFNPLRYLTDYIYYWFSLLYLLSRFLYVFLSAAAINEKSQSPKVLLHNIPQEHWNEESDRLLFQINSSKIALSAMGFFNFSRGLILTMAGTIVTFELVMMQLGNTVNGLKPLCDR